MTRILPVSDLHFEFHRDYGKSFVSSAIKSDDVDILIVAGDLSSSEYLSTSLDILCETFPKVVAVLGNHEFYNSSYSKVIKITESACKRHSNLYYLNNNKVTLNNITFAGTTLWFSDPENSYLKNRMNDFKVIHNFESWVYKENQKAKKFLSKSIDKEDLVITHFLPTNKSIHSDYKDSPINCFFVSDVEDIIVKNKPRYWFHGHTHKSMNYKLDDCQIICNPFGYARFDENLNFNPSFRVEI